MMNDYDVYSDKETEKRIKFKNAKKKAKRIFILILIVVILAGGTFTVLMNREKIAYFLLAKDEPEVVDLIDIIEPDTVITAEYISKKLENISSLQTAKITYGCMVDFESGTTFLNRKSFSMFYEATASASIDISKIVVTEEDGKYKVNLPVAVLDKPYIDSKSFVFYDKEQGLINRRDVEDMQIALEYAEHDVKKQSTTDQLLDIADANAVTVISNLLVCFIPEDSFEVIPALRNEAAKIKPPISSTDAVEKYDGSDDSNGDARDLEAKFKEAGFTNVRLIKIEDLKIAVLTKEFAVESISIDGDSSFKKSNVFSADAEVIIKYHCKKSK